LELALAKMSGPFNYVAQLFADETLAKRAHNGNAARTRVGFEAVN